MTQVSAWAIETVRDYLRMHFPHDDVDHVANPERDADEFRVVRHGQPAHHLRVSRRYLTAHDHPDTLTVALVRSDAATRMTRADTGVVELGAED